jgi:hypothetical protein
MRWVGGPDRPSGMGRGGPTARSGGYGRYPAGDGLGARQRSFPLGKGVRGDGATTTARRVAEGFVRGGPQGGTAATAMEGRWAGGHRGGAPLLLVVVVIIFTHTLTAHAYFHASSHLTIFHKLDASHLPSIIYYSYHSTFILSTPIWASVAWPSAAVSRALFKPTFVLSYGLCAPARRWFT